MKRIIAVLLIAVLFCCSMPMSVFAMREKTEEEQLEEIKEMIQQLIDASNRVPEFVDKAEALTNFQKNLQAIMGVASKVGTVLGLVNGSVSFLKLIGVIKDGTAEALANILDVLQSVDEKITEMDAKLDDITSKMSEYAAKSEFRDRTKTALEFESIWNNFSYTYMENGMDRLMREYDSMCRGGLMEWCYNENTSARSSAGINNTQIILAWTVDKEGNREPVFSIDNKVVRASADMPYIIIGSNVIPQYIEWDINDYPACMEKALEEGIRNALSEGRYADFETDHLPGFSKETADQLTDKQLKQICADAVQVLAYRVGAAKVNSDAKFAGNVSSTFKNYTLRLLRPHDGLDAIFNTFYYTHAFEYQVKSDLELLCDELIVKTGVYGQFAANILGASKISSDAEKTDTLCDMCDCIEGILQAKKNGITGDKRYCYITNSQLYITELNMRTCEYISWHYEPEGGYKIFDGHENWKMEISTGWSYARAIGDDTMLVLNYMLRSNGVYADAKYYHDNIGIQVEQIHGEDIVTSYTSPTTFTIGTEAVKAVNVIGSYFKDGSVFVNLPSSASNGYVLDRRKVSGSLFRPASGTVVSNAPLMISGSYGERHWYWIKDEAAVFYGPAGTSNVVDTVSVDRNEKKTGNVYYDEYHYIQANYNAMVCLPFERQQLTSSKELDPLDSYTKSWAEIAPKEPHPVVYNDPEIDTLDDVDMARTVWNTVDNNDERSEEGCLQYLEKSMAEAGLPSDALTQDEKQECAAAMMKMVLATTASGEKFEKTRCEDPLGLGQNSKKLKELASEVIPDYLLNDRGGLGAEVTDVFARLHYDPFVYISFNEDGKPILSPGWSVTPYLVVCVINGDGTDVLNIRVPDAVMKSRKLRMNVVLPFEDEGRGNVAVHCFDNEKELNDLRMAAGIADDKLSGCVRFKSKAGEYAFVIDVSADVPDTGDNSQIYAVMFTAATVVLTFMYVRRKRSFVN